MEGEEVGLRFVGFTVGILLGLRLGTDLLKLGCEVGILLGFLVGVAIGTLLDLYDGFDVVTPFVDNTSKCTTVKSNQR